MVSISPSLADGNGSSQSLEFTISSSGTATGQLSVYFTPGGTAPGTAYDLVDASGNPLSLPLDVPAGGSTNVYVKPLGPLPPWSDETVTLTLDPGHSGYTVDPDAQDAAAILDAPALPEVSFDSSTIQQEVTEDGDPNGIDVTFNVYVLQGVRPSDGRCLRGLRHGDGRRATRCHAAGGGHRTVRRGPDASQSGRPRQQQRRGRGR